MCQEMNQVNHQASGQLSIERLSKAYEGKQVLKDLTFTFEAGRTYCLMAPSGAGKTTLFRILMGLELPDSGIITGLAGKRIAAVFQEDRLLSGYTALQNIRFVTGNLYTRQDLIRIASRLLSEKDLDSPVYTFSGGMKRRTAILRAILSPSDIVILDEPFTGLDHEIKLRVIDMIKEFCKGKLLLAATHEEEDSSLLGALLLRLADMQAAVP